MKAHPISKRRPAANTERMMVLGLTRFRARRHSREGLPTALVPCYALDVLPPRRSPGTKCQSGFERPANYFACEHTNSASRPSNPAYCSGAVQCILIIIHDAYKDAYKEFNVVPWLAQWVYAIISSWPRAQDQTAYERSKATPP
jgi:hypothetical protein